MATLWEKPDVFHGLTTWHLYTLQQRLAAGDWRESVQAKEWVGHLVATVAGLSTETDKGRIKAIIRTWRRNEALAVEHRTINGRDVPFVIVGKAVDPREAGRRPHLPLGECGGGVVRVNAWNDRKQGADEMTETGKTKARRPATKGKAAAQPEARTITIPCPDTDCPKAATSILEKEVPGWENLDKLERAELIRLIGEYRSHVAPAKVKLIRKSEGGYSIDPDGKSEMLAILKLHETFSATSMDPVNARASELIKYLDSIGACTDARYNAALSFIESMAPQNQAETLLLVEMYVTHDAAIRALSQLGSAEWVPTAQTFGNLATKLLRTSRGQMETLARMRRGGEQVVRHIHVDKSRRPSRHCRERANRGPRKWKNRRSIPWNRNHRHWRRPRVAWRGPVRTRSANLQP